jgi:FkbM family methyltransferase
MSSLEVCPRGVLHVGAHLGEERQDYLQWKWDPIVWVEANPYLAGQLELIVDKSREMVVSGAAWNISGQMLDLQIMNNTQTSSLFEFTDFDHHPNFERTEVVKVHSIALKDVIERADKLLGTKPDYLHLDIQGSELEALKGLGSYLFGFKVIYTEVAIREVYSGQPLLPEIEAYLAKFGFKRVFTRMVPFEGWGDAVFLGSNELAQLNYIKRIRLTKLKILLTYQNLKWAIAMKRLRG